MISNQKKTYLVNIIIGLTILLILHSLEKTKFGEGILNKFFDISIKYFEEDKNFEDPDILFVDISHKDYVSWNRPYFIPYDSIANIINFASITGAEQVIVDIDCDLRKREYVNTDNLMITLNKLKNGNGYSDIIFPVLRNPFENKIQNSFLDTLVYQNNNLHQGLPQFAKTSLDQEIRYMRFFTFLSNKNKDFYWSVPFQSAAINNNVIDSLNDELKFALMRNPNDIHLLETPEGKIYVSNDNLFVNRLKFKFRGKYEGTKWIPNLSFANRLEYSTYRQFPDYFKNKIVIIGSSAPEFGDIHETPVGLMPGMYIIGNAIEMLINYKQTVPPPLYPIILVEIIIIIFMSFLFEKYNSFVALISSIALIILLIGPFTFWLYYHYGIFINLILPVISMRSLMYITKMKNISNNWRKK